MVVHFWGQEEKDAPTGHPHALQGVLFKAYCPNPLVDKGMETYI